MTEPGDLYHLSDEELELVHLMFAVVQAMTHLKMHVWTQTQEQDFIALQRRIERSAGIALLQGPEGKP